MDFSMFFEAEVFMHRSLFAALVLLLAGNSPSLAASCKEWVRQPNGSQVRSCVGDLGKSYCESCTASGCAQAKCPDADESHPPSFYNPPRPAPPRPPS
jgi:hypothetical protein